MREGMGGEKIFQAEDKTCLKVLKKREPGCERSRTPATMAAGPWGMETVTWGRYGDNLMFHPNCPCEIIEGFGLGYAAALGEGEADRFGGRGCQ